MALAAVTKLEGAESSENNPLALGDLLDDRVQGGVDYFGCNRL